MKRIGRTLAGMVLGLAASGFGLAPATAAIVINGPADAQHIPQLVLADGDTVRLTPDPVTYLNAATAPMQTALTASFPTWKFVFSQAGLAGTMTIDQYKATSKGPHNGGGLIDLTYTRDEDDPLIAHLFWIQLVTTNRPLGGADSPYIDPWPNDDLLPFYWTRLEDLDARTAQTYRFFDNSSRTAAAHPELITWRGDLMLASWEDDNVQNVTVYDGIRWGWNLQTVPEPASWLLVLIAIASLVLAKRLERH